MIDELIDKIREEIRGIEEGISLGTIGLLRTTLDLIRVHKGKECGPHAAIKHDRQILADELLDKINKEITEESMEVKQYPIELLESLFRIIRKTSDSGL